MNKEQAGKGDDKRERVKQDRPLHPEREKNQSSERRTYDRAEPVQKLPTSKGPGQVCFTYNIKNKSDQPGIHKWIADAHRGYHEQQANKLKDGGGIAAGWKRQWQDTRGREQE